MKVKFQKPGNQALADQILKDVRKTIEEESEDKDVQAINYNYRLIPYVNGREHGWTLRCWHSGYSISWSQIRNGDRIVVYAGNSIRSDGSISEEQYKNAKYFGTSENAAFHIACELYTGIREMKTTIE